MEIPLLIFLISSLFLGSSAHAAAPPAPVPQTGQTTCYKGAGFAIIDRETSIIACAKTGQDGNTQTGVAWPTPRFTDNSDKTITDNLTGLAWTRDANPAGSHKTWQQALDYIKTLNSRNHLGHNDWRLPNLNELESLVNKETNLVDWLSSKGFTNIRVDYYWTSSTYASYTNNAWSVGMYGGILAGRAKSEGSYVWPVRSSPPGVVTLPKTGQTDCYDNSGKTIACPGTGQDGETQAGAAWPTHRFADNADNTITDRLTGLVWSKDGNAPGPNGCSPGTSKTWQNALDYIKCLNINSYLGKSDWRLPNRNELMTLVNHGQSNSATWLNAQGFSNVVAANYWSSTSYAYATWNGWTTSMHDGAVTSITKKISHCAWPVRSER